MNIRGALDRIVTLEGSLNIAEPLALSVKKAWKYMPSAKAARGIETPCFFNEWTVQPMQFSSGLLTRVYTVHMQLAVEDADGDRAADIASAFEYQLLQALAADVTLNGACSYIRELRGGNPTLVVLESPSGKQLIGLDLYVDVVMTEGQVYAP